MNDTNITRLVVGGPMTVTLGIPVGQRIVQPSASSISWSSGAWVGIGRKAGHASFIAHARNMLARVANSQKRVAGVLAAIAIVVGGSVGGAYFLNRTGAASIPFAPAAAHGGSVRVLEEPYSPAVQPPPPEAPAASAGLPIAPAEIIAGSAPSLPITDARAARPAATQAARPALAPTASDKAKPAAVVLDEEQSLPQAARIPQSAATGTKTLQVSAIATQKAASADRETGPVRASSRGAGLVAVTPDGKFALFSNPTTRMPEQFKVGDRLPTGDTIRSIDVKSGKVVTSAKEYELE